ncbi:MAG TPA: WecB/TagA/CpsF family glycosyltransferase [Patescibacteria group bacterium]|nr:WecB/TagA/CpsF family glycosyltransferase [Patescibacteria group bacterium]
MKVNLLGVGLSLGSFNELLEEAAQFLESGDKGRYVVTPNPEFLVYASRDYQFRDILNKANLSIPDGVGLLWASRVLGLPLRERITGADFGEALIKKAAQTGQPVFFLGGRGDVAARAAQSMSAKYPNLVVSGSWSGNGGVEGDEETLREIGREKVGLLLVAYGHPKQEYWLSRNLGRLNVSVAMGVGGSFDYWSGDIARAPFWMRSAGLEWLYRLIRQPWRIKRQLALLKFIYLIFREKFRQ